MSSWNHRIIEEFRANNGKVGGMFDGAPMVVLTTAGRTTGKPHTTPAIYLEDGGRYLVFGSNLGRDNHPDWYLNMLASAQVTMEIGTADGAVKPFATRAVPLDGEERDRLYDKQCSIDPAFREYQDKTSRTIPVVALYPLDLGANPERNQMIGKLLVQHHNDLRADLARVSEEIDRVLSGEPSASATPDLLAQLRKRCLTYCYGLQMHHTREDGSFTAFEQQFPHLVPAIAKLRAEHKTVEHALARFEQLLDQDFDGPADVAKIRAELDQVVAGLEEHFAYEEEHLLPAVNVQPPS